MKTFCKPKHKSGANISESQHKANREKGKIIQEIKTQN